MKYLKVTGNSDLVRDVESRAIINTSDNGYNEFMIKRNLQLYQRDLIARQDNEIQMLKNDISDIKQMLLTLINNK
jgi:predicted polyphosphate/ATP-dependent NAD kinase